MTIIFGFSGRARCGKTYSCEAIKRHVINGGGTAKIYDVGNMVRLYCIDNGLLPQVERENMTKEQLAILVDIGARQRAVDPEFWCRQMFAAIEAENVDVALIPNLRMQNEVDGVRARGGYVIRVKRLNADGSEYISPDRDPNHFLETSLEFWPADFYITAKSGQAQLIEAFAVAMFDHVLGKLMVI